MRYISLLIRVPYKIVDNELDANISFKIGAQQHGIGEPPLFQSIYRIISIDGKKIIRLAYIFVAEKYATYQDDEEWQRVYRHELSHLILGLFGHTNIDDLMSSSSQSNKLRDRDLIEMGRIIQLIPPGTTIY